MTWWAHWQSLREDHAWGLHGRAWLKHRPRGQFGVEWHAPTSHWHAEVTLGGAHHQICLSVACGLFAVWLTIDDWPALYRWLPQDGGREMSVSAHDGGLWWRLWCEEDAWHASTPRWRDGSFLPVAVLLGRPRHSCVILEERAVTIALPEGCYLGWATLSEHAWRHPRWTWPRRHRSISIEFPPGAGIPVPGKGENAWDCEDSAIASFSSSTGAFGDAVEALCRSATRTREQYGGSDWRPEPRGAADASVPE